MNNNAGFGSSGIPYEEAVREAKSGKLMLKKVLLILAYVGYAGGLLLAGSMTKLILPLLALIPIWLYRGRKGYSARWFQYLCYGFYPAHMLLLVLIRML